ncbi:mannose-1-phosphate guanylyltransferase/mannose-6-phosphate isomerase [Yersinia bercovieri]|uniref:mannose-1-phosphate guanylyltransferase/mannose-6-phosphate isomerase n=1 Tax=Yersinia bercovieri TaxID=634 RepID=UPI00070A0B3D|nr:mannose-1-phosphate guanylyltransferase/mannose-6-phosphate isomerase [Yersinia bercovieri]
MNNIVPVIMAGGTGSRLWPLSREKYPKQFLSLTESGKSMLQETILRLKKLACHSPLIICNEVNRFLVAEQLRQIDMLDCKIVLEPVGRNTAPAIALAAEIILEEYLEEPLLLVLAADHLIKNTDEFIESIIVGCELAKTNYLVTFGIVPTHPEVGYGYIKKGPAINKYAFKVNAFVEKPDYERAEKYLSSGEYSWNSGMFIFKTKKYLQELKCYSPDIYFSCHNAIRNRTLDMGFIRINETIFSNCPSNSIDFAVMEKTEDAVVIPIDVGWSDVGSWSSLWDISPKDDKGNVKYGDVISIDSENNYIYTTTGLVATIGISNLIVINTDDALLISHKNDVQKVKAIVDKLNEKKSFLVKDHKTSFRPWGEICSIDSSPGYQVKRITVRPGEGLSLQLHHHRAEHWIVVAGIAKVSVDGQESYLTENESIYIPIAKTHVLENPGEIDLEIIEVRSGKYLNEDDVIRIHDRYGR